MARDDSGFTLVEAVVSVALFAVVALATSTAVLTIVKGTNATRSRVTATQLARQEIETLRLANAQGRQLVATPVLAGGYTVTPVMSPAATATCATGTARAVSVVVTWPGGSLRVDTELAC